MESLSISFQTFSTAPHDGEISPPRLSVFETLLDTPTFFLSQRECTTGISEAEQEDLSPKERHPQPMPTPIIGSRDLEDGKDIRTVIKFSVEDNHILCQSNIVSDIIDLFLPSEVIPGLSHEQGQQKDMRKCSIAKAKRHCIHQHTHEIDSFDSETNGTPCKQMISKFSCDADNRSTSSNTSSIRSVSLKQRMQKVFGGASAVISSTSEEDSKTTRKNEDWHLSGQEDDIDSSSLSSSARNKHVEKWDMRFEQLADFKCTYGHCNVPNEYPQNAKLAQWVKRQRYQHKLKMAGKRSSLTDERQRALEDVGFVWDSHESIWTVRWNELKEFRNKFGHSNVPAYYSSNCKLSIWVKCQRRQYKLYKSGSPSSSMTVERIKKLNSLDFDWDRRKPV